MKIFTYLEKIAFGLPTYDSGSLIAAKKYRPSLDSSSPVSPYDLYKKKVDPFMFGAITPTNDANDLLSSSQLEERAHEIYDLYRK